MIYGFYEDQLLELIEQQMFKEDESIYILEQIIKLKGDKLNELISQLKRNMVVTLELDDDKDQEYINWLTLKDQLRVEEKNNNNISLREFRDPRITAARLSLKDYNLAFDDISHRHIANIKKIYGIKHSDWHIKDYINDFTDTHIYPGIVYGMMNYDYNGKIYSEMINGNTWIDLWITAEKLITESDSLHWRIVDFINPGSGSVELKASS